MSIRSLSYACSKTCSIHITRIHMHLHAVLGAPCRLEDSLFKVLHFSHGITHAYKDWKLRLTSLSVGVGKSLKYAANINPTINLICLILVNLMQFSKQGSWKYFAKASKTKKRFHKFISNPNILFLVPFHQQE